MEKKQVDLLSMLHFDDLSENELKEIQHKVEASLQVINDEKIRRKRIKEEYIVEYPEREYRPNLHLFYRKVHEAADSGQSLSSEFIHNIDESTQIPLPYDYTKIYRCPICGNWTLECGEYHERKGTYTIACYHWEFELPKKYIGYSDTDAWRGLHNYLQTHGYVSEDVKFLY